MVRKRGMQRETTSLKTKHPYATAPMSTPPAVAFAGPGPAGIAIQAIEVCQTIQSIDNTVTLVANKATLVRVYLDQSRVAAATKVRGEMTFKTSAQGPATYVPAMNELVLDPADGSVIDDKRDAIAKSLNFRLPDAATAAGTLIIEVNRVMQTGGDDLPLSGPRSATVTFVAAAPLRIRCIGLRYRDAQGKTFSPNAVHFTYLRSFLERAYPVPSVIWSQIVVDASFAAPFNDDTVVEANMQIAAIRSSEVNSGVDPRTHYVALVDDGNGKNFMRGRAMGIPTTPQPDTVASAPCGVPNGFGGDDDPSYADWYGAHELGHTFGRYHPGFPPGQQDASDPAFPFQNGQLSNADRRFVGYDLGDANLGLPLQSMAGISHHDVMTYANNQWLCQHTFEGIRVRLIAEDEQFAPAVA
ncbi:hypothetical protein JJB99_07935 [Bradyrhizobium diazoefficiens]|uniref:hypothetical protein n=1 Tax=Bradyrhizobium diazoefficiens TaxID=1355477 RepID=UPI00190AE801|nr:hypothetical protein [Bradyrhizobium diazoefficiens]QQO16073.1 hypothetical protein JJB99_07935 [Bradyrhizobium diazoefficiens]